MKDIPAQTIWEGLSWVYDRVLANKKSVAAPPGNEGATDSAIRWAVAQAGLIGFTTGLGGAFTLPVSLPVNVAGVSAIQIHMVQEIARIRGYDLGSAQVRTLTIGCLAGGAVIDALKTAGISAGTALTRTMLLQLSGAALAAVNRTVGTKLAARAGVMNVGKFVPVVGGLIGGAVDGASTAAIGAVAKRVFVADAPLPAVAPPGPLLLEQPYLEHGV